MTILSKIKMETRSLKCIVIGDRGAGKTCLLIAYMEHKFPTTYTPTVYENAVAELVVDNKSYNLGLWDTYCQMDDYGQWLRPLMYPQTDVALVCLSTVAPQSIHSLKKRFVHDSDDETRSDWVPGWIPEITTYCPNVPFILVGTKTDLREDRLVVDSLGERGEKPLSKQMGEDLAKEVGAVKYLECSARTQEGVQHVMEEAVRAVLENSVEQVKMENSVEQVKPRRCSLM